MATMTEAQARLMSHDARVECVMGDIPAYGDTVQSTTSDTRLWGLDRIDQRNRPLSGTYTYQNSGVSVHAYVVDTGIYAQHPDLGGRVFLDCTAIPGTTPDDDCTSATHGTSVASIIGGIQAGVAKSTYLHSVKVLNSNNKTFVSTCTGGLDWVLKNHRSPSVVNCSWGFHKQGSSWFGLVAGTTPFEKVIRRLVQAGVTVVVSAGNENVDASSRSPAWMPEVISVGASDQSDSRAIFGGGQASNYGNSITLFAPGFNVLAAHWTGQGTSRTADMWGFYGTSAAAPFVTGVVAQYLQSNPSASPATVKTWLKNNASVGVLNASSLPAGTPNLLLFTNL